MCILLFLVVGLGYGRNSKGGVDETCHGTMGRMACLLFCYDMRKQSPTIRGVNIRRVDYRCCCENNTIEYKEDKGFLYYVLEYN